jgi:UDP-glucose 4-epimerase
MMPNPLSPYAVSKLAGEKYCQVFSRLYGIETVILRYFNVFGPRQDPNSEYSAVIPKFITLISNNQQPTIFGDGKQSRDFTYVANVVEANILAATKEVESGIVMNCACHGQVTLNDLVIELNRLIAKNIEPIYAEPRHGDIKHSFANINLIKNNLNFKPKVNFIEGLERTINIK